MTNEERARELAEKLLPATELYSQEIAMARQERAMPNIRVAFDALEREALALAEEAVKHAASLDENSYIAEKSKYIEAIRALEPTPITAIFPDGTRKQIGTSYEPGIVTTKNAGTIILELQECISELQTPPEPTTDMVRSGVYVASRASIPERSAMWRQLRDEGMKINSTWIDEAGEGETSDFGDLWIRIAGEVSQSFALVVYAERHDFPLKGALVEVGMAMGQGIPIIAVLPDVVLEERTDRPIGSWVRHPNVEICVNLGQMHIALARAALRMAEDEKVKSFIIDPDNNSAFAQDVRAAGLVVPNNQRKAIGQSGDAMPDVTGILAVALREVMSLVQPPSHGNKRPTWQDIYPVMERARAALRMAEDGR